MMGKSLLCAALISPDFRPMYLFYDDGNDGNDGDDGDYDGGEASEEEDDNQMNKTENKTNMRRR